MSKFKSRTALFILVIALWAMTATSAFAGGGKLIGHYWRMSFEFPFYHTQYFDVTAWAGDGRSGISQCPQSIYDMTWALLPGEENCAWK